MENKQVKAVYEYWVNLRMQKGNSLLRKYIKRFPIKDENEALLKNPLTTFM